MRLIALAGALVCALLSASPVFAQSGASGGVPPQPDGWVRYHSLHAGGDKYLEVEPWKGDNVYNSSGRYQTSKQLAGGNYAPGAYYVFQVTIESDGSADSYRVRATGTGNWVTKYQRGKTNITSAVVNGTYETPVLDGTQLVLKVKVWIGNPGESIERLLTVTSVSNPNRSDTVRIKASYSLCGC